MRKKFWLQFHLWTVALLAVLTIANVVSALRPFSSRNLRQNGVSPGEFRLSSNASNSDRNPASSLGPLVDAAQTLKLAQLPCEPKLRLVVSEHVKNLRLQFDSCAKTDDVVSIRNATNGFEGTIFGNAAAEAAPAESKEIAGFFVEANRPLPKAPERKIASNAKAHTGPPTTITTDYISLAPGANEIRIQRSSRSQILKIERR